MNKVMDILYDLVEHVEYTVIRLLEIAVVAFLFWGFWCVMVWAVNAYVGGG